MGSTRNILFECGRDLGFSLRDGRIVLTLGGSDAENLRNDVRHVGRDLRTVMERRPL